MHRGQKVDAIVIMNACQGDEYNTAEHTLNQLDGEEITLARVVEQLRSVEQDVRTDAANAARGFLNKSGQRSRSNIDRSKIECYRCGKKGYYKSECPDQQEEEDADDKNETSRPRNDRKASSKSQSQPPRRKEKVALAAEECQSIDIISRPKYG